MIGTSKSVWGFDPRSVPGCQLWLDAADATTVTGTTSVTAWRDKSANGYVANSFVNSVPNPSWVSNVRNGNGVIQYTAGNGSSIANFVLAQTMSIFKVYYPINQSTGSPFIEQGPNAGSESGFFFHSQNDNNFYIRAGSIGIANFGTTTVSNTWQMIEGINPDPANGNTVAFYVNGITRASGGTQSDTTTVTKTLYINGRAGTGNVSYNTYLAELIIYNIAVTNTQRQQIEGYLAHKWGLTTSVPSTHPFSSIRPHLRVFQPIDVPGCQLWLDADDALNFTGSTWTDKSGTNNHAVNGTPGITSMPTVTSWSNGRRAARFVRASKNSIKTTNVIPIYVTYFIVARVQGTVTDFGFIMVNNVDGQRQVRTNSTSFPVTVFFFTQTGGTDMVFGTFSQGQEFMFSGTVTSGSAIAYGNGAQRGTSSVNNSTPSRHYFGSGDGDNNYLSVDIAEVLIYDSVLTTSERQQVEGYLAWKWGLTGYYSPTTPLSIPGCQLWLDGLDSSTVSFSSGSNVSSWSDKSGNGRNATVYAGTPTYTSALGMTFNGSSSLQITYTASPTIESMFVVIKFNSVSAQGDILSGTASGQREYLMYSPYSPGTIYLGRHTTAPSGAINGGTVTTGLNYLLGYVFNGTGNTISFFQSGNTITSGTPQFTYSSGGTISLIGSYNGGGYLQGQIYEMIIYSTALTTTQRQQVEGYLARKWGISISATLPSPHPFKSFPPASLPFSPRNISGLALWLDAADQSSMTLSGSNVTQIRDKSANGYTFTGSVGTYPTRTATLNGLPVISSANGQFVRNTSFNQNFTTASCFIVMRPTEDITPNSKFGNGYPLYCFFTGSGSGAFQFGINYANQTQNPGDNTRFTVSINRSGTGLLNGALGGSNVSTYNPVNTTLLISGVLSGTSATNSMFLNGSPINLNLNNAGTLPLISSLTMDCIGLAGGQSFGYNFAESIVYGSILTATQVQQVEGYLAQKWGLTTSLPATHPYKKLPA